MSKEIEQKLNHLIQDVDSLMWETQLGNPAKFIYLYSLMIADSAPVSEQVLIKKMMTDFSLSQSDFCEAINQLIEAKLINVSKQVVDYVMMNHYTINRPRLASVPEPPYSIKSKK